MAALFAQLSIIHYQLSTTLKQLRLILVPHTDEIKNAVQPQGRDGLFRILFDQRFGAKGNAQAGFTEHGQVVGAVTYGDDLFQADAFLGRNVFQQVGFALAVDDLADNPASDLAILDFQFVGMDVINAQQLL